MADEGRKLTLFLAAIGIGLMVGMATRIEPLATMTAAGIVAGFALSR